MHRILQLPERLARRIILVLDALLRRRFGIYEYTQDPECVLRIALRRSHSTCTLSDGTVIQEGAPIVELHFWNEHIPRMGPAGPDLAWGLRFYRRLRKSLAELARYVNQTPEMKGVVAFRGESSFAAEVGWERYADVMRRLGFEFRPLPPQNAWQRFVGFFEHLYVWALIWAFNPVSLRGKRLLTAARGELWISRQRLLERYLPTEAAQPVGFEGMQEPPVPADYQSHGREERPQSYVRGPKSPRADVE